MSELLPVSWPALATGLASLNRSGARRYFRFDYATVPEPVAGEGWVSLGSLFTADQVAERAGADPVASLGIDELTGTMVFHALAVPLVDLAVSLLTVAELVVDVAPAAVLVRFDGPSVIEVALRSRTAAATMATTATTATGGDQVAQWLVAGLEPLVDAVVPHDPALRWGAVADLVVVIANARARAHGLDAEAGWAASETVVTGLRNRRPHPQYRPGRVMVPAADPAGGMAVLARRSTCCEWYRAARHLGEDSVTEARCADCPSLDPAVNVVRLAALAKSGDLANP